MEGLIMGLQLIPHFPELAISRRTYLHDMPMYCFVSKNWIFSAKDRAKREALGNLLACGGEMMKSFIFKRSLFSEIWFEDILLEDEEKELIRILYNKPEPEYQVEEKIDWEAREARRKQADYDKWQSYDERNPFHYQIFPTDTIAYAQQQVEKFIEDVDNFLEWFYDDEVKRYILERNEIYQKKFDLV
ncbi:TPA: hypothetical protein PXA70_002404, partial [Mannheimia haemolytica]|nr:hypothetical protein [Mannheimia haemolytica]HDL5119181.1 hypothetical protein [Mannheimia haemolytica]HDL5467527.1 hypothetical protein [Mannheimia haemolytica]HDL5500572.1 hypothetical protein [Mannheimia haemolytica]HDL5589731.1 hypothetical protein [Mannheimia haemolytica]